MSNESYLGDLNKTQHIARLLQLPFAERDRRWQEEFLTHIPEASFRCGEPQVIVGPDGFPYFQLFLPEAGKPFQCFVLQHMKDDFLLEKGFGVVLNPTAQGADWVFSYGDILHYYLKGTFEYAKIPQNRSPKEVIQKEEQVLTGAPSESILPIVSRRVIGRFLKDNGLLQPKCFLMVRNGKNELIFNITPKSTGGEQQCQRILQYLTWYLPRDYQIGSLDENQFKDHFYPLDSSDSD